MNTLDIRRKVMSDWNLQENVRSTLKRSFIRVWSGPHLKKQVIDSVIEYGPDFYNTIWLSAPEDCFAAEAVGLSFRAQHEHLNYVLIKVWNEE